MATAHLLKITLKDGKPPVWRRVLVPSAYTLSEVQEALLTAMGWAGYRLASFRIGSTTYMDIDDDWPHDAIDPSTVRLGDLVGGPWGYGDFVDAIGDPQHDRHDELLEWIGGSFDPAAFDAAEVDAIFAALADPT